MPFWKTESQRLEQACVALLGLAALTSCRAAGSDVSSSSDPSADFLADTAAHSAKLDAGGAGRLPVCTALPGERVSYQARVLEYNSGLPPRGLEVRACERAGDTCQLLQYQLGAAPDDALEIELPRGFAGVIDFRAPLLDRTRVWLPGPLCENERAALPVWVLSPVLENDQVVSITGAEVPPNQLLLQRRDCSGAVRLFPPQGSDDSRLRVSSALPGGSPGGRSFTIVGGGPLPRQGQGIDDDTDAGIDPALIAGYRAPAAELPTVFTNLPTDQDLAIEVFDFVQHYEAIYLHLSAHETAIATALVSDCEERAHAPR
jgi:hypothetical protein